MTNEACQVEPLSVFTDVQILQGVGVCAGSLGDETRGLGEEGAGRLGMRLAGLRT